MTVEDGGGATELDAENAPRAIRERHQWICWTDENREKVPMRPDASGDYAKVNDSATWGTFEEAAAAAADGDWGVGIVFTETDPYVGVDIDECLDEDGRPAEWLPEPLPIGEGGYAERSPSGRGLHLVVEDEEVPAWWQNQHDGDREVAVFESGKYFTVTGDEFEASTHGPASTSDFESWLREAWKRFNDGPPELTDDVGREAGGSEPPDFSVYDLSFVSRGEYPPDQRGPHPVHGSTTGANFMVDTGGETWRCWRHEATGNAYQLLGVACSVIDCGQWVHGSVSSAEWREILELAEARGLTDDTTPTGEDTPKSLERDVSAQTGLVPTPAEVKALAGLDSDDSLGGLPTAQRAHYAWRWIAEHDHVIAVQPDGELYAYEDGVWEPTGEQRLRELGQLLLDAHYSERVHRELCERARANAPVQRERLGTGGGEVPLANGLLDMDERAIRDLEPSDYALVRLPVEFDPDADCERWTEFVNEVVPERWRDAVQEFVGYCLCVGRLPIHRALMLVGEGANGKSTFLGTVRALLGEDNVRAHTLHALAREEYARAGLFGAVANIHADLSPGSLGYASQFKTLVGGDAVQARRPYQDFFEFEPTAKLLFAANQVPDVDIEDLAFFRRWLVVEFPEHIPRDERDRALPEKLAADGELSGILNWALEGRDRLLDQGRFTGEGEPFEKRARWMEWGDSVSRFIEECVDVDAENGSRIAASAVHDAYVEYCDGLDERAVGQGVLTKELKAAGADYGRHRIDGEVQRGFKGAALTGEMSEQGDKQGSLAQAQEIQAVYEAVEAAQEEDDQVGGERERVLDVAEAKGLERDRVDHQIDRLLERGELLEHDQDRLERT
jgi:putative DNA primase/helicase